MNNATTNNNDTLKSKIKESEVIKSDIQTLIDNILTRVDWHQSIAISEQIDEFEEKHRPKGTRCCGMQFPPDWEEIYNYNKNVFLPYLKNLQQTIE